MFSTYIVKLQFSGNQYLVLLYVWLVQRIFHCRLRILSVRARSPAAPSPSTYFKPDQAEPNCIGVYWHLNRRWRFPTCGLIRNKGTAFLHKPPARLFSDSTFDHWRLDGLGTGPITSKWNIEFPFFFFFAKPGPFSKGGGISKCTPACQVVYILLLGFLSSLEVRTMDTVWPEARVSQRENSVVLHKLYKF